MNRTWITKRELVSDGVTVQATATMKEESVKVYLNDMIIVYDLYSGVWK